jgi:predicted PurR-regulated permease PerM
MQRSKLIASWWQSLAPFSRFLAVLLVAPLMVLNAWAVSAIFGYFHSLIVILVAASLLAFLLNYPVSWLEQRGAQRQQSAILVFLVTLSILLGLGVTLLPIAFSQAQQLVARLPEWIDSGQRQLVSLNERAESMGLPINLDAIAAQINNRLKGQLQTIAGQVLNLAVVTFTSILDGLLTIVLTFYLLQHGDELWQSLISWLPANVRRPVSETISLSFQNFFIGQLILATCMASALVPYGGSVGIALVTLLVALRDIGLGVQVLIAAVIVQQILENLIAPRVLGSVTGLNPVWVFISILTGARVGGLLGVVVAVPTAVVIKAALEAIRSAEVEQNLPSRTSSTAESLAKPESELSRI